jgi:hypothetical protein
MTTLRQKILSPLRSPPRFAQNRSQLFERGPREPQARLNFAQFGEPRQTRRGNLAHRPRHSSF